MFNDFDIVFVADLFLEDYGGGAERSTESLFSVSPYKVCKVYSKDVTQELIQQGIQKTWVFFNFRGMNHNLIPMIVGNLHYFVVEYDYKFCQFRSLDLHKRETGKLCDCLDTNLGKIISAFYHGSEHIFWMSQKQMEIYHKNFPFLKDNKQTVLSSLFNVSDLEYIERLRNSKKQHNGKWAVIDGNSWIKGVDESVNEVYSQFPEDEPEVISNLSYYDLLSRLSEFKGLSFQPLGDDTCPRTVIEAKLLGLELLINEKVQHKNEEWFQKSIDEIESYLLGRHQVFWQEIENFLNQEIKLSGYTTTKDVIENDYPWEASIQSMLGFCDEVVVVDGGSKDGTWEKLVAWAETEPKLKIQQIIRDWNHYRFALFDFQQKAEARKLCTGNWCWQMDIDEVVHEEDYEKVKKLISQLPKSSQVICLPVIDFWGKKDKVRLDVHPWKWRLSRNKDYITHDIPKTHRAFDENGNLYSLGSDGCDYVEKETYELIPTVNFYTSQIDEFRRNLLNNIDYRNDNLQKYVDFINTCLTQLPSVYHYSWTDIERKIHNYKNFWTKFHASLYNRKVEDLPENNMMFDAKWSEINDSQIKELANKLEEEMGGWIFHSRIDFSKKTPWYFINKSHPKVIQSWLNNRK